MEWRQEWKPFAVVVGIFLVCFYLPVGTVRFDNAVLEALFLVKWYAREHVLLCLVPAFFIAGAIAVFVSQASVMRYLGPQAKKVMAYGVASVSGSLLAVCSCTVLPLFSGIYKMGAGLGPAATFLYAGPAINVLAIILTARVLGIELGVALAVCAVFFRIIIGLLMQPNTLATIRESRTRLMTGDKSESARLMDYYDIRKVTQEYRYSEQLFIKHNWRVIDVTRWAIEEISGEILDIAELGTWPETMQ